MKKAIFVFTFLNSALKVTSAQTNHSLEEKTGPLAFVVNGESVHFVNTLRKILRLRTTNTFKVRVEKY